MKSSFTLILSLLFHFGILSQVIQITEKASMPFKQSNNAVSLGYQNGIPFLYTFGGIDSTKLYSGINQKCARYNIASDTWDTLPNLPDASGKIASGASTVNNKIYIFGGYHVLANGNESSSNKVHVFNPETNLFEADATPIPVPIDDHVQAVWKDSLIYLITGWSNSGNVPNVQIFNPTSGTWLAGTSIPNTTIYKAFGACGTIIGDTIYYLSGAATGTNFPLQNYLRKGIIDPTNPSVILWSQPTQIAKIYRGIATTTNQNDVFFLGGSAISYNYNGIAYNGSGGVNPQNNAYYFQANSPQDFVQTAAVLPMDLRGIGELNATTKYICGGMLAGQEVSNHCYEIKIQSDLTINELSNTLLFFPNPSDGIVHFNETLISAKLLQLDGKEVGAFSTLNQLDLVNFPAGMYVLEFTTKEKKGRISIRKH